MKARLRLALFLALAGSPAFAQPAPQRPVPDVTTEAGQDVDTLQKDINAMFSPTGLTADQAAIRSAKASPDVLRKAYELEASLAQLETAKLSEIPQVKGTASYTRNSPVSLNLAGFMLSYPNNWYATEASLGVPLSEYLLRFPKVIEAAHLGVEAAQTGKHLSQLNAGLQGRLAYYEWLRSRLQVLVAEHQLTNVQTVLKQMQALADAQRVSKADLMRVQSGEAVSEQAVATLRNVASLREEQLRILIGAPDEQLTLGEDPRAELTAPALGPLDDAVKQATAQRLEFKVLDLGIQAKEAQRASEKANLFPHLSAFAIADYANPNTRVFPIEDKWKLTWSAGLQLSWTINDTLISRATDKRIAAETNELRADRENLARGTRIEILSAQQAVALAQVNMTTSLKGLAAAEESYRVRRELLNADRATAVELVDAETNLTQARILAINAHVDLRVAMAQLAHALGTDAK